MAPGQKDNLNIIRNRIRTLTVIQPDKSMKFVVGDRMKIGVISNIIHDIGYLGELGINKYDIYLSSGDEASVWKSIISCAVIVEYDQNAIQEKIYG